MHTHYFIIHTHFFSFFFWRNSFIHTNLTVRIIFEWFIQRKKKKRNRYNSFVVLFWGIDWVDCINYFYVYMRNDTLFVRCVLNSFFDFVKFKMAGKHAALFQMISDLYEYWLSLSLANNWKHKQTTFTTNLFAKRKKAQQIK